MSATVPVVVAGRLGGRLGGRALPGRDPAASGAPLPPPPLLLGGREVEKEVEEGAPGRGPEAGMLALRPRCAFAPMWGGMAESGAGGSPPSREPGAGGGVRVLSVAAAAAAARAVEEDKDRGGGGAAAALDTLRELPGRGGPRDLGGGGVPAAALGVEVPVAPARLSTHLPSSLSKTKVLVSPSLALMGPCCCCGRLASLRRNQLPSQEER